MGAGLLPRRFTGKAEIVMLVVFGILSAYLYGILMNLSGWPFILGIEVTGHAGSLSLVPGDPLLENLHRFGVYTLLTSTGGWDTGRAITNSIAIVVLGPAILATGRTAWCRVGTTLLLLLHEQASASEPMSEPVTVSITRHVDPAQEDQMRAWLRAGFELSERFDGFLGRLRAVGTVRRLPRLGLGTPGA